MKVDALILPEVIIARVLTAIVKMIRDDIALATPQEVRNTILFQLLGENEDGQPIHMNAYNYFRQAVKNLAHAEQEGVAGDLLARAAAE